MQFLADLSCEKRKERNKEVERGKKYVGQKRKGHFSLLKTRQYLHYTEGNTVGQRTKVLRSIMSCKPLKVMDSHSKTLSAEEHIKCVMLFS